MTAGSGRASRAAGAPPGHEGADPRTFGRPERLVVIVGTGTEVGKTWVTVRLASELRRLGAVVVARKPAQSFEPDDDPAGLDAALLARATDAWPEEVCPRWRWYPVAMAPPMAAEALGQQTFSIDQLVQELRWPSSPPAGVGLVETAGGVRSPLADDGDAVDLADRLCPDVVVLVANAGLGAVHAVRSSADALRRTRTQGTWPVVVVLNRYDPLDPVHRANRSWLTARDRLEVIVTPGEEGDLAGRVLSLGAQPRCGHGPCSGPPNPSV
jgi:dethiobiotin synthetase